MTPAPCDAVAIAASCIRLQWPAAAAGRYRVERQEGGSDAWTELGRVADGLCSFESVGLRAETAYRHRIIDEERGGTVAFVAPELRTPAHPAGVPGTILIQPDARFRRNTESDLLPLGDGSLLCMIGRWPGESDHAQGVCIAAMRSSDGLRWSAPETLFAEPGYDLFHPCLVRIGDGRIGLSYTRRRSAQAFLQVGEKVFRASDDDGRSWSDEIVISDGGWEHYQSSRCGVLRRLASGRVVQPVQRHLVRGKGELEDGGGTATLIYVSDDDGRSWRRANEPFREPERNVFHEAAVVEWAPGRLLVFGRTRTGWFWESRSDDGGDSWSLPQRAAVRSSVAPPQLLRVPDSDEILLLWCPYVGKGRMLGPRPILAAARSRDGGRSWFGYRELAHATLYDCTNDHDCRGFCYATAAWQGDHLHLTYLDMLGSGCGFVSRSLRLERAWILGGAAQSRRIQDAALVAGAVP